MPVASGVAPSAPLVVERVRGRELRPRRPRPEPGAASLYQTVAFRQDTSYLAVGERTNANGSRVFRDAMLDGRFEDSVEVARDATRDGSHLIDVCVDYVGRDGVVDMREIAGLNPSLQNQPLMTAHVSMAILSYATFAISFAAACLYLITSRRKVSWLPSAEMLDDIGYRAVTFGFPMLALVLILGSIWAYRAWGTYWSWDPKETSALFTWLVYGVYLHTRSLRGWRGRRSAYILLFGFGAVVFTYYGNYFFGGMHAYGGVK